jgi:hypothetical protein
MGTEVEAVTVDEEEALRTGADMDEVAMEADTGEAATINKLIERREFWGGCEYFATWITRLKLQLNVL